MNNEEKILVYNDQLFLISETFIFNQVTMLSKIRSVQLLANEFVNPHGYDLSNFEKHVINRPNRLSDRIVGKAIRRIFHTSLTLDIQSYIHFIQLLRKNKYKAIHAHFGHRGLELLGFARFYKIPLVVSFHGYDASKMLKVKAYAEKLPQLFNYASAIIISGRHMFDNLQLDQWKEKVHFIPYGVNPESFQFPTVNNNSEKIKILHSGRIVAKKGVPDLIRVFYDLSTKYDQIELHLVGDGNQLSECKELVSNLKLEEKVFFYGALPHEKVKEMLNKADIFVLNSRTDEEGDMEGTPVTILEAMCMGKPVVSTRHAGIPYVIDHNKNGLLANERSNDELRKNIDYLIGNPDLRKKLGREAKRTIEESYTSKITEKKILSIFENI